MHCKLVCGIKASTSRKTKNNKPSKYNLRLCGKLRTIVHSFDCNAHIIDVYKCGGISVHFKFNYCVELIIIEIHRVKYIEY